MRRTVEIAADRGDYAHAPDVVRLPAPDVTIDRIGDLTTYDMPALLDAARRKGIQ